MTGLHCIFCGYELPGIQMMEGSVWDIIKVKCPNCEEEILIDARKALDAKTKIIIKYRG